MEKKIRPLLKWVGGKRQLIDYIKPLIPKDYSTYVEPFFGGGAIFFELEPKQAIINDYNSDLMNVYKIVRDNPDELIEKLIFFKKNFTKEYFYEVRAWDRSVGYNRRNNIDKAARFIFLNKTCYNGLYRVNSKGQFNTPLGRYVNPNIVNNDLIKDLSKYFKKNKIEIISGNYSEVLKDLHSKSFVYLDPPYAPLSLTSSFTGYTNKGFNLLDQKILKDECDCLANQNIFFVQSNSDCPFIRELYSDYYFKEVPAKRTINSKALGRGAIGEVLISNHDINKKKE